MEVGEGLPRVLSSLVKVGRQGEGFWAPCAQLVTRWPCAVEGQLHADSPARAQTLAFHAAPSSPDLRGLGLFLAGKTVTLPLL